MDFGFETLNGLTQTASGVTTALKGATDLVGSIKAMLQAPERRGDADIEAAVERLALTMENARLHNALLEAAVQKLQQDLRRAQEAEANLQAYELHATPGGAVVYALKDAENAGQPAHFICANCREEGRRSILQGGAIVKACPRCKTRFAMQLTPFGV